MRNTWVTLMIIGFTQAKTNTRHKATLADCVRALSQSIHLLEKVCLASVRDLSDIESLTVEDVNTLTRHLTFVDGIAQLKTVRKSDEFQMLFSLTNMIDKDRLDAFTAFSRAFQSHLTAPPES